MLNLPLCHWSSQLFDLRAPSSTDVPVLLLNQPNDSAKRALWKLAIVKELLPWSDDRIRAAVIQVEGSKTLLKRSIKHLIPIEVKLNVDALTEPDGPISQCRNRCHQQTSPKSGDKWRTITEI